MTGFESFVESLRANRPEVDVEPVTVAYETAARWHRGQRRKSGAPYITHPVAVAEIVADLGMSQQVICAALLHDIVDDTPYTESQLRAEFGEEIASLVRGGDSPEATVLKLADRLHNMRTIRFVPHARRLVTSQQTLEIHAPLAHQLGFHAIKRELEDRALDLLRPADRRGGSRRALAVGALLLPARARSRWLEEWTGELSVLPAGPKRARFALGVMLYSLPRLAVSLRRPHGKGSGWITGIAGTLTALGAVSATQLPVVAIAVVGGLLLLGCVLFAKSDRAARRLAELIRAWRKP